MSTFTLNKNFQLGVVLGGVQSDGGKIPNSWELWHSKGFIKDASSPEIAAKHWQYWRDDLKIMQHMNLHTCRLCLDWARIEPSDGVFDEAAIGRVAQELYQLRSAGIRTMLTLHRFSDPIWFLKRGGWENKENIICFLKYAEKVVRTLGHLVSEFITLDEPNLHAIESYLKGTWAPGKKSKPAAMQAMSVMAAAHIRCYRLVHSVRRELGFDDTAVGCSVHMRALEPKKSGNRFSTAAAASTERIFQTAMAEAMISGRFLRGMKNHALAREGNYADFIGLAYYTRAYVAGSTQIMRNGVAKSDLGWEICPDGLIRCVEKLRSICSAPVYITANGVCDNSDSFRCRFLSDHLTAIVESGLPIGRYYYNSLLDGFEYLCGSSARFGLVSANPENGERRLKKSGEFFRDIVKSSGVTEQMYDKYVAQERYQLR